MSNRINLITSYKFGDKTYNTRRGLVERIAYDMVGIIRANIINRTPLHLRTIPYDHAVDKELCIRAKRRVDKLLTEAGI